MRTVLHPRRRSTGVGISLDDLRRDGASACRILAGEGLADGILGHVSIRISDDRMLLRCRGPEERGLAFTQPADMRDVFLRGGLAEESEGYAVPNEWPIHGRTLERRPEVGAVVHAHPRNVVLCGIGGLALRPVFGAYDIPAMRLAADGIPVYQRSVLIRRIELADDMLAAMDGRPVAILRGHGLTATGSTVAQAVARAMAVNVLGGVMLDLARSGLSADDVSADDIAELPDLGSAFNDEMLWRHLTAKHDVPAR